MNRSRPKEEEHQLRRCWRPSAILSDDVGNKGVLQNGDFVAQKQFPFFQTGKLQLIPTARIDQRHDRRIQIPVLLAQDFKTAHDVFWIPRSEEHTSELQSLMRISYAVFCLT